MMLLLGFFSVSYAENNFPYNNNGLQGNNSKIYYNNETNIGTNTVNGKRYSGYHNSNNNRPTQMPRPVQNPYQYSKPAYYNNPGYGNAAYSNPAYNNYGNMNIDQMVRQANQAIPSYMYQPPPANMNMNRPPEFLNGSPMDMVTPEMMEFVK